MNIKKLYLSLITAGVLAALSSATPAYALSNYTLNGNYIITGDLYVDSLLGHVGQCLEVGTGPLGASEIVATGSPCGGGGGGGVTSVTANDPDGNLTIAPTTGAVIVSMSDSPTFDEINSNNTINSTNNVNAGTNVTAGGDVYAATTLRSGSFAGHTGQCLEVGVSNAVTPTGSPCGGGGGVTSVTAGPSGNTTVAPNTGAVVVDIVGTPTFAGTVTSVGFIQPDNNKGNPIVSWDDPDDTVNLISADNSFSVAGIANYEFGISQPSTPLNFLAINAAGSTGVLDLNDAALTPGDCVQAGPNGHLTTTGSACGGGGGGVSSVTAGDSNVTVAPNTGAVVVGSNPNPTYNSIMTGTITDTGSLSVTNGVTAGSYGSINFATNSPVCTNGGQELTTTGCSGGFPPVQQLHGNQSITAVASACTAGTPITFTTPFTAVPDIVGSTGPIVGDTFAPTAITTTGFTPEVCSVASAAPVTVYWSAQN